MNEGSQKIPLLQVHQSIEFCNYLKNIFKFLSIFQIFKRNKNNNVDLLVGVVTVISYVVRTT